MARKAEALPGEPRENEMTWFLLGAIYERQKQYDKAEEQFKKVLTVNPKNPEALNYFGYMLADSRHAPRRSARHDQRALDQEPFNAHISTAWGGLTSSRTRSRMPRRRCARLRSASPTTPRSAPSRDVYAKQGRLDLAAAEWEKSLEEWRRSLPADLESGQSRGTRKKTGPGEAPRGAEVAVAIRNPETIACAKSVFRRTQRSICVLKSSANAPMATTNCAPYFRRFPSTTHCASGLPAKRRFRC